MKKLLVAGAALAALIGTPALAADMALKAAPPPVAPACVWCGWYIGVNAGYTWGNNSVNNVGAVNFVNPAFPAGAGAVAGALATLGTNNFSVNTGGFIGGAQIGWNHQVNNIVAGVEADIQGVASKHTATVNAFTTLAPNFPGESYTSTSSATNKVNYLGTVRGRLGVTVPPTSTVLAYVTGGLAYGGVSSNTSVAAVESLGNPPYLPVAGAGGFSGTRVGWTAGGGLEWMLVGKWSAKVEVLYYDLGKVTSNFNLVQNCVPGFCAAPTAGPWGGAVVTSTTRFNGSIARVGLNLHL